MGDGVPASGHVGLHRRVRRQPGHCGVAAAGSDQRDTLPILLRNTPTLPARAGGDAAGATRVDHHARQRLRSRHPAAVHPVVVGGLAAQDLARLGDRAALRRQQARERLGLDQHQRAQHHHAMASSTSSVWRRPTCRPTSPPAAARRSPTPARARTPLPIMLAHFNAQNAANAGNAAALHRRQLDQRDVPRLPRRAQSESVGLREPRAPAV